MADFAKQSHMVATSFLKVIVDYNRETFEIGITCGSHSSQQNNIILRSTQLQGLYPFPTLIFVKSKQS